MKDKRFGGSSLDEEAEKMYDEEYRQPERSAPVGRMDEIAAVMSAEELYERGKLLRDSKNILERMPTDAVKYFTKAAEKGHVESKYELACMYENGVGCEVDIEKAKEYYNSAAGYDHGKAKQALKRLDK